MLSLESLLPEHLGLIATAVDRITRLQEQNAAYLAHAAYLESLCARSPTNGDAPASRDSIPRRWTPDSLLQFDFGPVAHFIAPWYPTESICVLYGNREAGKTQLVLTALKAAASNGLLLGRYRCANLRTAFIEVDMPARFMQERFRAMGAVHHFTADTLNLWTLPTLNILSCNANTQWVQEVNDWGAEHLVFDSLRKIHRLKENDTDAASEVYGKLRLLFPHKTFTLLHHMKKPPPTWQQEKEQYSPGDDEETYRGATSWIDDANVAVHLYRDPQHHKRVFSVVRSQQVPDAVKRHSATAFEIDQFNLFLNPLEPTAEMRLLELHQQQPGTTVRQAVDWLLQQPAFSKFKERWAYGVVNDLGVFEPAKRGPKPAPKDL